jgi:nucleoid-associated protein YgaU
MPTDEDKLSKAVKPAQAPKPAEQKASAMMDDLTKRTAEAMVAGKAKAAQPEPVAPKFIAEHTLTAEETLSHLSLKYYGHATQPYWMLIYEVNKDVVGDNPNHVRAGMKLKIPELPAEMKK